MFFYLKKDLHPEPKKMIFRVFILGALVACFVAIIESLVLSFTKDAHIATIFLESFLLVALVEEIAKYLVVRVYVYPSPELDEPLDLMLYMVISALGFAALENAILFFSLGQDYIAQAVIKFALLRFIGAIFLHTLTSGTVGYFIVKSIYSNRNKKLIFLFGFFIAIISHGLYNLSVVGLTEPLRYLIPTGVIVVLAIFTTFGFIKLRKMKAGSRLPLS